MNTGGAAPKFHYLISRVQHVQGRYFSQFLGPPPTVPRVVVRCYLVAYINPR